MPADPPPRLNTYWAERLRREHGQTLDPARAALLADLGQLDRSQWLDPAALAALQLQLAEPLLRHAARHVPFYRERIPAALLGRGAAPSPQDWRTLPILTRQELICAGGSIVSDPLPAGHGETDWTQTSGSTGEPVRVMTTGRVGLLWRLMLMREQEWRGRDLDASLAVLRPNPRIDPTPQGSTHPDWGAFRGITRTGPAALLDLRNDTGTQLTWLCARNPHYLLTFPSNLALLLKHSARTGQRPERLREAQTVGEPVAEELRAACREVWGVPLVDAYSSQEAGYMALQCPEHEHLHVQSESVLLEVLSEDGRPCPPGVIGRIVITALHNYATPLIRYDIGDLGVLGPPCPCGRGLPVLTRIVGRTRDLVVLPSGVSYWPLVGMHLFRDIATVRQYQVVQESLTTLRARLVVDAPLNPDQEQALAEAICSGVGHPFAVVFEYPAAIARTRSGKYREFVCEVAQPDPANGSADQTA